MNIPPQPINKFIFIHKIIYNDTEQIHVTIVNQIAHTITKLINIEIPLLSISF